jgi:Radical SAM superfamily
MIHPPHRLWGNLTPDHIESAVRLSNAAFARRIARMGAGMGLRVARHLPGAAIEQWVYDSLLRPAACCPEGGAHLRFLHRYVGQLRNTRSRALLRTHLLTGDPRRASLRVESFARIVSLAMLRHELLRRFSDRPGFPTEPLIEVQLAAYPDCDLSCEGCYAKDDRRGSSPDAARLAWFVDQAASCGACAIHVVGKGEPFLSEARGRELLAVAEARPHLLFVIATHGMAIEPHLPAMARLGNLLLLVSLDGPRDVHDGRRGKGTYDRVRSAMRGLRRHGVAFGTSTMVSGASWEAVTSGEFLGGIEEEGAILAVLSRFFPLSADSPLHLSLSEEALAQVRVRVDRARGRSAIPILDLDELEAHTGCRSRAGLSIHIDVATGSVSPCIRVPFAPAGCTLDPSGATTLADILRSEYFETYRRGAGSSVHWCGADMAGELASIQEQLRRLGPPSTRLEAYRGRVENQVCRGALRRAHGEISS